MASETDGRGEFMKVAIVGGGFTGLACAVRLIERGHKPIIFEAGKQCGGLAAGFNPGDWKWNLEYFYHHVFTNDKDILDLANKVGCRVLVNEPVTTSFVHQKEVALDSPVSLLTFPAISFWGRLRMGIGLAMLRIISNGLFLERYRAVDVLPRLLGIEGYQLVWEKLLSAKFGPYVKEVNMAWFWSRVAKRTKRLDYFEEGFRGLIDKTVRFIVDSGGEVRTEKEVKRIVDKNVGVMVNEEKFDAVVMTTPAPVSEKLLEGLRFPRINYLWGQTLVVEVEKKIIGGYWMNVLEKEFPFLVVVDQTNMIDKKNYGSKRVIYFGNYLPDGHKQLKMTKEQLVKLYLPYIRKISKHFNKRQIKRSFLFRAPYAQPVFPTNYSKLLPKLRRGKSIYVANMSMVYPFDRGTNYAVKMGFDVAEKLIDDLR